MKISKNFLKIFFFIIIFLCFKFSISAQNNPFGIDFPIKSEAIYFINLDSDTLILEKNKNLKLPCSALAKMMTTILVLESDQYKKNPQKFLKKEITATADIFERLYLKEASNADLKRGETITVKDALYATMLQSACEACMMLVNLISKNNVDGFVEKMNDKAKELNLTNTFFTDPDGLDTKNQYTTAYDMYILTKYCLKNDMFKKIATTKIYEIPPTNMHKNPIELIHTNKMLNIFQGGKNYDERVKGIKTARADSRFNLISIAQQNSYNYLLIILGLPVPQNTTIDYSEPKALYDWAFKNLKLEVVAVPGEKTIPNKINIKLAANAQDFAITPKEQITLLLPSSVDKSTIFWDTSSLPQEINAPIKKGTTIGTVFLKLSDAKIKEIEVMALKDVHANIISFIIHWFYKIISSFWFISLFILILIIVSFLMFNNKLNPKKNRKKSFKKYKPFK